MNLINQIIIAVSLAVIAAYFLILTILTVMVYSSCDIFDDFSLSPLFITLTEPIIDLLALRLLPYLVASYIVWHLMPSAETAVFII